MKKSILFFCLLLLACSSKEKEKETIEQVEVIPIEKNYETKATTIEMSFEELQDSLRKVLLNSKLNENLKSSLFQELYIRGLVVEENGEISFDLPFNLHGLDGGVPDCYSTDLSFKIPSNKPIEFPEKIDVKLHEYGCVDKEETIKSTFIQKEKSTEYLNYFSEDLQSNLVIKKNGELYYYPHLKSYSISVRAIDEMFENAEFDDAEIAPYQSTVMTSNEYERFLEK